MYTLRIISNVILIDQNGQTVIICGLVVLIYAQFEYRDFLVSKEVLYAQMNNSPERPLFDPPNL